MAAGMINQLTAEVGMLRHQLVLAMSNHQGVPAAFPMSGGTPMALPGQIPYPSAAVPLGMPMLTQAATPKVRSC